MKDYRIVEDGIATSSTRDPPSPTTHTAAQRRFITAITARSTRSRARGGSTARANSPT